MVASRKRSTRCLQSLAVFALSIHLFATLASPANRANASYTAEQFLRALEQYLRKRISNPKNPKDLHLRIVPTSNPRDAMHGKVALVEISSKPARVKSVTLLEFRVRVIEPVIDVRALIEEDSLRVISVKDSFCEGIMTPKSFEQMFAEGKHTKNMHIKVKFRPDKQVELTGHWTLFGINNPFRAVGRVFPARDGSVHVRFTELYFNRVPVPDWLKRHLEKKLNPVLKREDMIFNPFIRTVELRGNQMFISTRPRSQAVSSRSKKSQAQNAKEG